jgi:hypothetical protein
MEFTDQQYKLAMQKLIAAGIITDTGNYWEITDDFIERFDKEEEEVRKGYSNDQLRKPGIHDRIENEAFDRTYKSFNLDPKDEELRPGWCIIQWVMFGENTDGRSYYHGKEQYSKHEMNKGPNYQVKRDSEAQRDTVQRLKALGVIVETDNFYELTEKFLEKYHKWKKVLTEGPGLRTNDSINQDTIFRTISEFDRTWEISERAQAVLIIEDIFNSGEPGMRK